MTTWAMTIDGAPAGDFAAANDSMQDEERALVRAATAGDPRAFERLYRRHVGRILGLCLRLCDGDRARAEQSVQDAFVRAWEKLASFRGESQFGTWMHRLTVNLVLGEQRLLRRWVTLDDALPEAESAAADLMPSPQAQVADRIDLERALARLPKGARTVLWLFDVEGYQHEEIAALTGIAVGTSKAQLHRARRLMKEMLQ